MLARATVESGFCFSLGRYLRLLVLLSLFFTQFSHPSISFRETSFDVGQSAGAVKHVLRVEAINAERQVPPPTSSTPHNTSHPFTQPAQDLTNRLESSISVTRTREMSYLASIHHASAVRHAIKANFLAPDESSLLVAYATRLLGSTWTFAAQSANTHMTVQ